VHYFNFEHGVYISLTILLLAQILIATQTHSDKVLLTLTGVGLVAALASFLTLNKYPKKSWDIGMLFSFIVTLSMALSAKFL
jgi:hypothetical protein